jgi:ferredoxin
VTRVEVDRELCAGTGGCEALAPEVFEIGDDGALVVHRTEPDERELPAVRAAVAACPTRALSLTSG